MKGVYLINESEQERMTYEQTAALSYIKANQIEVVKLNPHQLNNYYTIPHALLFDLKRTNAHFDCLVVPSQKTIEEFIYAYPARWLLIKSFFKEIIFIEQSEKDYLEGTS